ncbi:ABC transporter ATP-binding protein [Conexibacter sp. SYSU D00693]|uniref:ABC transporter ATP-binding protein n=1 Tax=Conexibacter sp. SYSU D00693 TaxID=2812560 RepID=UPI001F11AD32|nr:ABC transporter ATP-binding protein [Conexibacter sp. SYSU D00693]
MSGSLLEARGVRVELGGTTIVHQADLDLRAGELVAVVGPNGAGKSTLVRAAAGLQRVAAGTVRWGGEDVARLRGRKLARLRAFVPQRPRVPEGITVRQAVDLGRAPHLSPLRRPTRADHDAVDRALARTGVTAFADRRLTTLSGGELQRVQISVALAQESPALLADEPTSSLDLGATAAVAQLLRGLADDGLAVLLVVHDLALAAAVADRVVVVSEGRTVATGDPHDVLDPERLSHVWHVDAALEADPAGRTALHVAWLGGDRRPLSTKEPA